MPDTSHEIEAITSSRRNTVRLIQRLKDIGEPILLTVNGKTELTLRDETTGEMLIELVDRIETLDALRESLKDEAEGRLLGLDEVKARVRRKHGIAL